MLGELAEHTPIITDTFAEASDALGYDLWQVVSNDANGELNQTEVTQPALLTSSVAVYRSLQELTEVRANTLAGHSLGEYTALTCAGVFTGRCSKTCTCRGQFMQALSLLGWVLCSRLSVWMMQVSNKFVPMYQLSRD